MQQYVMCGHGFDHKAYACAMDWMYYIVMYCFSYRSETMYYVAS